jgi:hypothetical protein
LRPFVPLVINFSSIIVRRMTFDTPPRWRERAGKRNRTEYILRGDVKPDLTF